MLEWPRTVARSAWLGSIGPTAGPASGSDPSFSPSLSPWAGPLLLAVAHEAALQRGGVSQASWTTYAQEVQSALDGGRLTSPEDFSALLESVPPGAAGAINQLRLLSRETNPRLFAQSCLHLATRLLRSGERPGLARALLEVGAAHADTAATAQQQLEIARGGGGLLAQLEFQAPQLARDLLNPISFASFGAAFAFGRLAGIGILSRSSRLTFSTLFASEAAAVLAEVPAYVFTRRTGERYFGNGTAVFSEGLGQELLAGMAPFALLRGTGNLIGAISPAIRRWAAGTGALTPAQRLALGGLRFGGEIGALTLGHSLNEFFHLAPDSGLSGIERLEHSLISALHLRAAGALLTRVGGHWFHEPLACEHSRLAAAGVHDLARALAIRTDGILWGRMSGQIQALLGTGRMHPLTLARWHSSLAAGHSTRVAREMEVLGLDLWSRLVSQRGFDGDGPGSDWHLPQRFALEGIPSGRMMSRHHDRVRPDILLSENQSGDGGGSGAPKTEPATGIRDRVRAAVDSLDSYSKEAENRDTRMGRAAGRLHEILQRLAKSPQVTDEVDSQLKEVIPTAELAEIEAELNAAQAKQTTVSQWVSRLRDGLASLRKSSATLPDQISESEGHIARDEETAGKISELLPRLNALLGAIRENGWNDRFRAQMSDLLARLNKIYPRGIWSLPGLNRVRAVQPSEGILNDHVQGALLGLGIRHLSPSDSLLAHELRGTDLALATPDDLNLELLHQTIFRSARGHFVNEGLEAGIRTLAEGYGVSTETADTLLLTAETLRLFHEARGIPMNLVDTLQAHPLSARLSWDWSPFLSLEDPEITLRQGLELFGPEPSAENYFLTGLYMLMRNGGQPDRFTQDLLSLQAPLPGSFHPTLPASLFGAGFGRSNFPAELLPSETNAELIIGRAQQKE